MNKYILIGEVFVVFIATLACGFSNGMELESLSGAVKSFATRIGSLGLDSTVEAFATGEVDGILETARVYATQEGQPLLATIEALATERGSKMLNTAQALITNEGSEFLVTVEEYATKQHLDVTVQAYLTKAEGFFSGDAPSDIPLIEGGKDVYKSSGLISYSTSLELSQVVDYYVTQMVVQGWQEVKVGSFRSDVAAVLNFEKARRQASIMLSLNPLGGTSVTIIVTTKQ